MELHKLITIVIPCKNEGKVIEQTLTLLNLQQGIDWVKVIVADNSTDDYTTYSLEKRNRDFFDLKIIQGGLPAEARNKGAEQSDTPYILFIDSDMFINDPYLIEGCVKKIIDERLDLVTCKVRSSTGKYNYVFRVFDLIQKVFKPITPFCLGGFMLVRTSTFKKIGGFDVTAQVAEDYLFSKQIKPRLFKVYDSVVFTTPRRFENKGLWYMTKLMIGSFLNRNNKKFFQDGQNYWK
jgi:glycosyltransferase involved in cell wall biosynthesis